MKWTREAIENLPREQKLLLFDVLEEKKRRDREKRDVYQPNKGQIQVHSSTAQTRIVTAGNGSGKTALGVNEAFWGVTGYNPVKGIFTKVPARGVIVLDKPEKVEESWLPEIRKWFNLRDDQLRKNGKPYINIIQFDNGSELRFMFHQQEEMAFESTEHSFVIFDEPPPRHVWVGLRRGGRTKGRPPWYLFIGTPIAQAWIRKELIEKAQKGLIQGVETFKYGTRVNEHNLTDNYQQEYGQFLSEKEKRIRFEGESFDLDGLALAHLFALDTHVVSKKNHPWDMSNPVVIAVDPHTAKPHHAIMLGVDRDNYLFVIKELSRKCIAREFARELKEWYEGFRIIDVIGDSAGEAETTSGEGFKSFMQVMREEGIRIRATTFSEKDDEDFIERIRGALAIDLDPNSAGLRLPKMRIYEGNTGIISDIENVQWVKYRTIDEHKPKLDIQNKDYLSCLKYALASNVHFSKTERKAYRPKKAPSSYGIKSSRTTKHFRNLLRPK